MVSMFPYLCTTKFQVSKMSKPHPNLSRYIVTSFFIALMALVAELTGQKEVVFPEAGALCVGLWLMPKAVWNVRSWQVPVLLTAAALIGLGINVLISVCFEVRFALAFVMVIALLCLVRCNMYPVVSAAMLPVLINTTSWVYPMSVLAISSILAIVRKWIPQMERVEYQCHGWLHWIGLTVALCFLLALEAVLTHLTLNSTPSTLNYALVPPLVVTMIEFANRKSGFRQRPWTIWGLILAAAVIGTSTEWLLHRFLGLPMAIGALLSAVLMLLIFRRYKPFAPAMAISMAPMLLPDAVLPYFPLLAAVGSAYFIAVGMFCFPPTAVFPPTDGNKD